MAIVNRHARGRIAVFVGSVRGRFVQFVIHFSGRERVFTQSGASSTVRHVRMPRPFVSWTFCVNRFLHRRRYVQNRVSIEEAIRLEGEAQGCDRHDRPIFDPRHVRVAEDVPNHQRRIFEGTIGGGPNRQTVARGVLVGIIARGEALIGIVGRNPKLVVNESGPLHHGCVGLHERRRIFARNKSIGYRSAQVVLALRIQNPPEAR